MSILAQVVIAALIAAVNIWRFGLVEGMFWTALLLGAAETAAHQHWPGGR